MREFFIAPAELYKFHLYCHTDYIFLAYLNAGILCLPTCLTLNMIPQIVFQTSFEVTLVTLVKLNAGNAGLSMGGMC